MYAKALQETTKAPTVMTRGYPTYGKSSQSGNLGVSLVARIINENFGWLFRTNHQEYDFGIDAQVDVVLEGGAVTGQMIALQIKYGTSFLNETNKWGYIYRGEQKHFNHLANYPMPVLIVVCDPISRECYWVEFCPEATSRAGHNWKITIPFQNKLANSKNDILELLPPPSDYLSKTEMNWALNEILTEFQPILFIISREEVEELNASEVRAFFDRLRSTRELAHHCQGKVELSFHGYDEDPRELFHIPEVRRFAALLAGALPELFFFAYTGSSAQGLRNLALCLTEVTILGAASNGDSAIPISFATDKLAQFMHEHWPGLNELTDWLQMSIDENKKITFDVVRALGLEPPPDDD